MSAQLTFAEGRDLLGFARNVFEQVAAFVDGLLAILEDDYAAILRERAEPGAREADAFDAPPEDTASSSR